MTSPEPPRIYLAGPEVFLPDATEIGAAKCAICSAHGLTGVFPLDGQLDLDGLPLGEKARRIALANEGLMYSCAATIANLTPFRGAAMDSGTAYEVGFMRALGKPVFGYSNVAVDYADRARAMRDIGLPGGYFDTDGVEIEDFGLAENLMIAIAVSETGPDLVRHASQAAAVRSDLDGFQRVVEAAAAFFKGAATT